MAKGKRKRKRPGGGGPAPARPDGDAALARARQAAREVADRIAAADPGEAGPLWGQAHKLLLKKVDTTRLSRAVATRDLDLLRALIDPADDGAPPAAAEPPPAAAEVPAEVRKEAMRAFRKRLKLTKLDHESRINVNPLTSGRKADVDAIMPPHEFGDEVWEALVAEGKLRPLGKGFYELGDHA